MPWPALLSPLWHGGSLEQATSEMRSSQARSVFFDATKHGLLRALMRFESRIRAAHGPVSRRPGRSSSRRQGGGQGADAHDALAGHGGVPSAALLPHRGASASRCAPAPRAHLPPCERPARLSASRLERWLQELIIRDSNDSLRIKQDTDEEHTP